MKTLGLLLALAVLFPSCRRDDRAATSASPPPAAPVPAGDEPLPEEVSFNEHIQPILSENCYHCHGPDSGTREPKDNPLRLDLADKAFLPRENGSPVIVKGDPAASLLMRLIRSGDPAEIMPPPTSHKKMSSRDAALVERWIRQGAGYQAHWSFIPPERPEVPGGGNPIDHLVAEKLAVSGLKENPPEDPRRFIRRLHLDITGLPPSPDAVEKFTREAAADYDAATARAADELLATPAAAEQQARLWLDAARYADTHGIHIDNYRAIWPYRDWVVEAFLRNQPWDSFTIDQIAGDMLPAATLEQRIATGFSRCLPTTGEGGAISEEYDAIYAKDRVETVSAVWLGLTTGCAACHDHKFDPITTEDFYSLAAFFRNTTMQAMDGNNSAHPPNVFAPIPADRPRWDELAGETAELESALAGRKAEAGPDFRKWLATATIGAAADGDSTLELHIPFDTAAPVIPGRWKGKPAAWDLGGSRRDGPLGPALLVNTVSKDLGDLVSIGRDDRLSFGALIYIEGTPRGSIIGRMDPAAAHRGWDLWLEGGKPAVHVIDRWPDSANKVTAPKPLEPGRWHHVMVTFDGTLASHQTMRLYVDGQAVPAGPDPNTLGQDLKVGVPLRIGSRAGGGEGPDGVVAIQDFRFYRRILSTAEIAELSRQAELRQYLAIDPAARTPAQTEALLDHYLATADAASMGPRARLQALRKEQNVIRDRGSITLVMEERKDGEPMAHILERGVYASKGRQVPAKVPASLPALAADQPHNRLGLARWLVDRRNPLTARVTVNRAWQQFFGTGIVESSGDFGIMGSRPTHPGLLDWLAVEFMDSGWDHRHILRLIATSRTYRRSAVISAEQLERDPYNRLLSRGPRHRLDAECLRDLALSASGLLSQEPGGPPAKPYQPEGIWEAVAMPQSNTRSYKADEGKGLHRRSIYTFWKRTAPPPSMEILNAPAREVTCSRRDQTNTPLQALVLLNDPQFIEASRVLAAHAILSSGDAAARLDYITSRLLGRRLDGEERGIVMASFGKAAATYASDPAAAGKLIRQGATPPDPAIPAAELAAWTLTASQILNLDEAVTR